MGVMSVNWNGQSTFRIQAVKRIRTFGGKTYHWYKYVRMKRGATDLVRDLRNQGWSARFVAQPGYGQGGWNIYRRKGGK